MGIRNYTPSLEAAISEARAAGLGDAASELEGACFRTVWPGWRKLLAFFKRRVPG